MKITNQVEDILLHKFISCVLNKANILCEEVKITAISGWNIQLNINGDDYYIRVRPCSLTEKNSDVAHYSLLKYQGNTDGWYHSEEIHTGTIIIKN